MNVDTLASQLFFTTVRIDTTTADGGRGSGTGFLFKYDFAGERYYPFVVTNKHVIEGMAGGVLSFSQGVDGSPLLGKSQRLAIGAEHWNAQWFGHPSPDIDIAICAFAPIERQIKQAQNVDLFYRFVDARLIPSEEQERELDALETVTFIGYPDGLWDSKNFLPLARRGMTASPIAVDFEGTPQFLIDASVFGGSSGSPVFILDQGPHMQRNGALVAETRFFFLGVVAEVYFRSSLNEIIPVPVPTHTQPLSRHEEMLDLGVVFKARTVVETVEAFFDSVGIDKATGNMRS